MSVLLTRAQADNAPTCRVPEVVHSLAAQVAQAPQLHAYYNLLKVPHLISILRHSKICQASKTMEAQ